MNTTPDSPDSDPLPQPPRPPSIPVKRKPHELGPMEEGTGIGASIASLLKSPGTILYELTNGRRAGWLAVSLCLITI
ncbi:MAG TPA: hypothetical protein VHM91_21665, partial [Verrucomicrobiales bacterium]|nr:hypothetical protein [Verrucomicrobiales bacterium]